MSFYSIVSVTKTTHMLQDQFQNCMDHASAPLQAADAATRDERACDADVGDELAVRLSDLGISPAQGEL
jgi:hypothetical protein